MRSPIQQAEREDAIADWLTAHGLDAGIAEALADTAVTIEALDRLAGSSTGRRSTRCSDGPPPAARSGTSPRRSRRRRIRIAGLVTAIKGFTHMDQATVAEPVDLASSGMGNTVAVLQGEGAGEDRSPSPSTPSPTFRARAGSPASSTRSGRT